MLSQKRQCMSPPTADDLKNKYLKCWGIVHPTTKTKYLTDGLLVFSKKHPHDIQFTLGDNGEFVPLDI